MTKADNSYQEILILVQKLQEEILGLKKENTNLRNRITELEHSKNSNNSSIPPSKDDNRIQRNQSLRTSSGKKSGGQPGHKGHTHKMVDTPDEIINHKLTFCKACGIDISGQTSTIYETRQVVELPPINPIYIEHRCYSTICTCGCFNKAGFPDRVKAPVQYGESIENLVAYLNVGQYLPYNRIVNMFRGLFNIPLSEGSVSNMISRFAKRAQPLYEQIRREIESSKVVGSDETGAKMNGEKWWFWTWQNKNGTYITASENRAFKTIENEFPKGFKKATLVSDRYGAHLKTKAYAHQICISHLLRDLNYLIELTGAKTIKRLKALLQQAIFLKSQMQPNEYQQSNLARNYIQRETFQLLSDEHNMEHKKVKSLMKNLNRCRNHIFEFLYNEQVPPDNNGSERAIRNVKVKQKVSTMFKSESGIINYAIIRSVFDTCTKRNIPVMMAYNMMNQHPE
jgi:transposase